MEYPSKDTAEAERILIDGFVLDKNHTFSAYPFSVLKNLQEPDRDWKMPERRTFNNVVSDPSLA